MGLDVYLYRYDITPEEYEKRAEAVEASGIEKALRKQAAAETGMPLNADGYPDWASPKGEATRDTYIARHHELCAEHQIDEYGSPTGYGIREEIRNDSALHPEHMFKIGYFRSSYNSAGTNRILQKTCGKSLDDIFPSDGDTYARKVDWSVSLVAARALRDEYKAFLEKNGDLDTVVVSHNFFSGLSKISEEDALKQYLEERARQSTRESPYNYSNGVGEFFAKNAFRVVAAIPCAGSLGTPAVTLIGQWERDPSAKDEPNWYVAALDVVVETCEWVLAQAHPERFYLHWSG